MADNRTKEISEALMARDAVLLSEILENMSSSQRASLLATNQHGSCEFQDVKPPLITAVQKGDLDSVKVLLKYKADTEIRGECLEYFCFLRVCTPLFVAAANGNIDILRCLIENGADVNARTDEYYTPLMVAVKEGDINVLNFLLEHGANVAIKDRCNGYTALHYACRFHSSLEVLSCLIENGADVNESTDDDCTPLMMACEHGLVKEVTFFIEHGANVAFQDKDGKTALYHAACYFDGSFEILSCLIENRADVNVGTNENSTPLMIAVKKGHTNVVTFLIEHGANVAVKEQCGLTALHYACIYHSPVAVLSCLVENGADINARTILDDTPLMRACKQGQVNAVRFLIEHGADVNLQDTVGETALHYAVSYFDGPCEILSCLIENGADVNKCANSRYSPLMLASSLGHVNAVTFLIEHGAAVNLQGEDGQTALHYTVQCSYESYEVLDCLIQNGADVDVQSNDGSTPLMKAIELSKVSIGTFLIEQGANMDLQNKNGDTAFHHAVCNDSSESIDSLLTLGASHMCNKQGLTPLLLASSTGKSQLVEYLIKRPEITKEQRIDALELLGASVITAYVELSFGFERGFKYIKRGMEERFADPSQPLLKQPIEPVEAYQDRKECQNLEEFAEIEDDLDAVVMESLYIRERILGKENPDVPFNIRQAASYYYNNNDWPTCVGLYRHAMKISQSSNQLVSYDLAFLSELFYKEFLRSGCANEKYVVELLEQTVLEYEKQRQRRGGRVDYNLDHHCLFTCSVHLISCVAKFQFSKVTKTSCLSVLLRKLCRHNPRDNMGNSLLHEVFRRCMVDKFSAHLDDAVMCLLNAGFNVNAVNKDGDTPLHLAVTLKPSGDQIHVLTETLKVLFDGGAHRDFVTKYGETPMDMAGTGEARMILSERRKLELKCVSARAVKKFGIPYLGVVPKTLEKYISMH